MQNLIKRLFDIFIALAGLVVLSPILLVCWVLVYLTMGKPAFFRQDRIGFSGKSFKLWKFRTMNEGKDITGVLLPDGERLTRLGRFLRSTSLDEFPTLFSVIKGDMSLVGPRPLLLRYLARYTPEQARRHTIKPGVTGWAQVNGRNSLTWEEKFVLDVWYVDHQSFWLDLKILMRTILLVLRRRGVAANGHASMPEFFGTCAPSTTQDANISNKPNG
jgi:lipopolysaccharide/colanic/teichoic acid biosynthesis glycosyltransferase